MASIKRNHSSSRPDTFICEWLSFQWRVYNFTDCKIITELTRKSQYFESLIKETSLYGNEHFLCELLDLYPDTANLRFEGDTILHIICKSKVKADVKACLVLSRFTFLNSTQNMRGSLPLHIAAVNNNCNLLREVIKAGQVNINAKSCNNLTALHIASHFGIEENIVELLSHEDIDVNAVDSKGDTALHHAAGKKYFKIYTRLANDHRCIATIRNTRGKRAEDDLVISFKRCTLTKSCDEFLNLADELTSLEISDQSGNTPLHWTMMDAQDGFKKFQYIIKRDGQLLKLHNDSKNWPIHIAARHDDKRFLEYILSLKIYVNVNAIGHRARTPLHMASFKGDLDLVNMLLHDFDLSLNAQDSDGNTALHIASIKGYYDIAKAIKSVPWCKTDMKNTQNQTPADVSTQSMKVAETVDKGTLQDLRNIIDQDKLEYKDSKNNTLLHICSSSKSYVREKTMLLVDRFPETMYISDQNGYMPIHIAAANDNAKVAEYLAENGCLNVLTVDKQTPLHIASYNGSITTVNMLVRFEDAHVNMQDGNNDTPAHLAAKNNHMEILSILENHSTYVPCMQNKHGQSPYEVCDALKALKQVFKTGSASSLEAMIKHWGKCLTKPVQNLLMPVMMDLKREKVSKIAVLASHFPELIEHYTDSYGNSFVHLALFAKDMPLLRLLLHSFESSCIINRRDNSGYTAWDYASLQMDREAIQLLERHRLFEQSAFGLNILTRCTFTEKDSIVVQEKPYSLHQIHGEIWHCCGDIVIYSTELKRLRRISGGDIGIIRSVANLHEAVAVAASRGLFILQYSEITGKRMRRINNDYVEDIRFHAGKLFCFSNERRNSNLVIQVYDSLTWQRICLIQSPCTCEQKHFHTLHVGSEYITFACHETDTIHTMTHTGDLVHSVRNHGYLHLCHTGSDAVLVGDFLNDRMMLKVEGEWLHVMREPPPGCAYDAVYIGGALFVLSRCGDNSHSRIIKYVCKYVGHT